MKFPLGRIGMLAVVALLTMAGAFATGVRSPHNALANGPGTTRHRGGPFLLADNTTECGAQDATAVATGNTFECNYVTTAPIPNGVGVDFMLTITAPAGTVFTTSVNDLPGYPGLIGPPLPAGCATAPVGNTFTISGCTGGPIPNPITLQVDVLGGPTPGDISMTAAYGGGPAGAPFPFPYQFENQSPPGPAAVVTQNTSPNGIQSIVCSNTTAGKAATDPFVVGDTFSCLVTFAGPNSATELTVDNTGVPAGSATFTLTGTQTDTFGFVYYTCGNAQTNTTCTSAAITGSFTGTGPIAFDIGAANLGANTFYLPLRIFSPASAPPITGAGAGGAFVFAAVGMNTPVTAAIACANSNNNLDIAFPAVAGVMTGFQQITTSPPLPTPGSAPGVLSLVAPTAIAGLSTPGLTAVECGAVFQDSVPVGIAFGQDADPNTIPGGTITFSLGGFTANGLTIAVILESGLNTTHAIPCGDASLPTIGPPPLPGGLESCQGAVSGPTGPGFPAGSTVSPNPANIVHVALRQGVSFSLIGGISPSITISATYQRFQALSAIVGVTGSGTISTNSATIGIATPTYSMSLTPSPASIPAALGSTIGSTITAALSRATAFQCVSVTGGFSGFVVCGTPGGVTGTLPLISFVNGAEPGVVTFSTSSGVFGLPGQPTASAQQIASVHCGAAPGTAPVFLVPFVGQPFSFSFSSCQSVSVTLFGGGVAGTAVVTAVYVGDFTGATATAATTVALTVSSPTVSLTRGCNEVITGPTTPAAATATQILALVSPSSVVVSIWQFNNGLHAFQALYFSTAGAPVDITSVGPNQSIFICVSGAATFTVQ